MVGDARFSRHGWTTLGFPAITGLIPRAAGFREKEE
jgi:hypothetical protein